METFKKHRQTRKREKKAEHLDHKESGRSITPSIDTEDMTTTASDGIEAHASVGGPSHYGDVEASSNVGKSQWWTLPCSWRSWSATWGMPRLQCDPLRLPCLLGMARGSGAGGVATSGAPNAIGTLLGERVGGSSPPTPSSVAVPQAQRKPTTRKRSSRYARLFSLLLFLSPSSFHIIS